MRMQSFYIMVKKFKKVKNKIALDTFCSIFKNIRKIVLPIFFKTKFMFAVNTSALLVHDDLNSNL